MRIGVVIAVEREAGAILADPSFAWIQAGENLYRSKAYLLDLALCGVGKALASYALARLACLPPLAPHSGSVKSEPGVFPLHDLYCALGTAGSLGNDAVGSMYLCRQAVERDMDTSGIGTPVGITAFEAMEDAVMETCPLDLALAVVESCAKAGIKLGWGRLLSGDSFVSSPEAAQQLRNSFGHGVDALSAEAPTAMLVDMETAALAKLCLLRIARPFFSVRWVSDNADHEASGSWEANVKRSSEDLLRVLKAIVGLSSGDLQ